MIQSTQNKIIDLQEFIGHQRQEQGKTLTFYFTKDDLTMFKKLQQWLHYRNQQTRALRAILKLAFLIVSKVQDGYAVHLEKPGAESLTVQLFRTN